MKISFIIPTYNEKDNVAPAIEGLRALDLGPREIIFVDDASPDGTEEVIRRAMESNPWVRLIARPGKLGLGSAYRDGLEAAEGDILIMTEADAIRDLGYVQNMMQAIRGGSGLVIASRFTKGGRTEKPLIQRLGSRIVNRFTRYWLHIPVSDFTSASRAITRDAFRKIRNQLTFSGHPDFLIQMVYLCHRRGAQIEEIPFVSEKRLSGRSKLDVIHSFTHSLPRYIRALRALKRNEKDTRYSYKRRD